MFEVNDHIASHPERSFISGSVEVNESFFFEIETVLLSGVLIRMGSSNIEHERVIEFEVYIWGLYLPHLVTILHFSCAVILLLFG